MTGTPEDSFKKLLQVPYKEVKPLLEEFRSSADFGRLTSQQKVAAEDECLRRHGWTWEEFNDSGSS